TLASRVELGAGSRERDAGLHPVNAAEEMDAAVLRADGVSDAKRNEDVGLAFGHREVGPQYPHYRVRIPGQRDLAPHDAFVAAPLPHPESVGEDRDALTVEDVVRARQGAAALGASAEDLEVVLRDEPARELDRLRAAGQRQRLDH